jgi:phospholipase/lecithinase/hemolysin
MHRKASGRLVWTAREPVTRRDQAQWRLASLVSLALLVMAKLACAGAFSAIIVFGDSLSDTGNVFHATSTVPGHAPIPISPPYFRGRFSNGFLWIEELANTVGLQITPWLDGGTNFAIGSAQTGADRDELFQQDIGVTILSLRSQVTAYRATLLDPTLTDPTRMKRAPADALYVVWGGANDLREAVRQGTQGASPDQIASDTVGNLVDIIRTLQSAGAIYFLIPNLPDLGLTPQQVARGPATMQLATTLSNAFNRTLESALQQLESTLPVQLARLDIATHFQELTTNPLRFGITNVTEACFSGDPFTSGTVCTQPESYIFWDAIGHPTAAAGALIADFALAALPPLVVTGGPHNPTDTLHISLPLLAQPVLQVRLGTTDEGVRLMHCTLSLAGQQGEATGVRTLKATVVQDTNANGIVDAGEALLATTQVQGLVDMLTLEFNPPLDLPPQTVTQLLVTLDINGPVSALSATPAAGLPGVRTASTWPVWSVAFLMALGSIGMRGGRTSSRQRWQSLGCLVLGCCLVLMSCSSSDNGDGHTESNSLVLTVSMPVAGLSATGSTSGSLTQPVSAIRGATLAVAP